MLFLKICESNTEDNSFTNENRDNVWWSIIDYKVVSINVK